VGATVGGESVGCGEGGNAYLVDAALSSEGVQQLADGGGGGGPRGKRGQGRGRGEGGMCGRRTGTSFPSLRLIRRHCDMFRRR
jgi:hypothetical protein